ncbi:MAG: hypothetical protein ACYSW4_06455 [Planctomycetota bacterium]
MKRKDVTKFKTAGRVVITWIYSARGKYRFCQRGDETFADGQNGHVKILMIATQSIRSFHS